MRARIGVAESTKLIELDVDDITDFKKSVIEAVKSGEVAWFIDAKGREVGIPAGRIGYVEVDTEDSGHRVGFGPAD